ncbi:MAG: hypothetical protein ACREAA_18505 [Candidatus Polarisedimenticolia bacterium]
MSTEGVVPRRYTAVVLGDGQVLPIEERVGRRLIRAIEPLSREGRSLLVSGQVMLWHDDGARHGLAPIAEVLESQASRALALRGAHPGVPAAHHDGTLRRIGRMKKAFSNPP